MKMFGQVAVTMMPWILLAESTFAQGPNPGSVQIVGVSGRGSGCPAGSFVTNLSPDRKALTVLFDDFIVDKETGVLRSGDHCNLDIELQTPRGWSYSLFCVDYRGFLDLDPGVEANMSTAYTQDGGNPRPFGTYRQRGPFSDDYQFLTALALDERPHSGCGGGRSRLSLETRVNVHGNPQGRGLATVDSLDGHVKHHYGIAWRRCQPTRIMTYAGNCAPQTAVSTGGAVSQSCRCPNGTTVMTLTDSWLNDRTTGPNRTSGIQACRVEGQGTTSVRGVARATAGSGNTQTWCQFACFKPQDAWIVE